MCPIRTLDSTANAYRAQERLQMYKNDTAEQINRNKNLSNFSQ